MPPSTKTATPRATPKPAPRPEPAANRPVHEIRLGRVRAAVWANPTDTGIRYNVTLCRLYKDDKSGEWRDSQSFGRDDLPLVMKVSDLAMLWIYENAAPYNGEK